ncbi:hypothetical protein B9G69_002985 [Bdellovibrio sp. SKB1291214]|uniref:hypothetical protein n=1 Tax=Bdellovibrio sp. SKB1291214 TaxID=1732569 RepID=UPI000B516D68|nr:hypothetical protein [Bdellovibrio sp. SKB1291214]UYL09536.1 hypothetical protein B9G69_002985 [Bdellovibrio sp. SKB1291214]
MSKRHFWITLIPVASVVFLILFFIPGLGEAIFSIDDSTLFTQSFLRNNWSWDSFKVLITPGYSPDFYPLRDLSTWIDWTFSKNIDVDTTIPKIQNLLWLIGIGILTFVFLKRITSQVFFSLIMSCAWFLHPFHLESLHWISARKDLMSWFFILCSVLFVQDYFQAKSRLDKWNLPLATLMFWFSLLCKAGFLLLPFSLLGWILFCTVFYKNKFSKSFIVWTGIGSGISVLFVLLNYWNYTENNYMQMTETGYIRFLSVMSALGRNLLGIVVPYYNAVDVEPWGGWYFYNKSFAPLGIVSIIGFVGMISYAVWKRNSRAILLCAIILSILAMTPGFNPQHRNFYSIRYFEPVFFVLWIVLCIRLNQTKRAVQYSILLLFGFGVAHASDAWSWQSNLDMTRKSHSISPQDPSLMGMLLLEYYNQDSWGRLNKEETAAYHALFRQTVAECVYAEKTNGRCLAFLAHVTELAEGTKTPKEELPNLLEKGLMKSIEIKKQVFSEVSESEIAWSVFRYKMTIGEFDLPSLRSYFANHKYIFDDFTRVRYLIYQCLEVNPAHSQKIYREWLSQSVIAQREVHEFIQGLRHENLRDTAKSCLYSKK